MNKNELDKLIVSCVNQTLDKNIKNINDIVTRSLKSKNDTYLNLDEKLIGSMLSSSIYISVQIGVESTIKILNELGLLSYDKEN